MPRKYKSTEAYLKPDVRYNSRMVSKFINNIMKDGKKSVAERIFYNAMDIVEKKITDVPPLDVFTTAINNLKPIMEVRSRRIGGANYQIPMEVPKKRQLSLAMRGFFKLHEAKKAVPCRKSLPMKSLLPIKKREQPLNIVKMFIRWLKPIRPSLISTGSQS